MTAALAAALALTLSGGASAAPNRYQGAMSRAGKAICKELPASAQPEACNVLQRDVTKDGPGIYDLSQAIEATEEAGRASKVTAPERSNYARLTLSKLQLYQATYRGTTAFAPTPGGTCVTTKPKFPKRRNCYYDDDAWTGVALVTLYHWTRNQAYLHAANQDWQFEKTGQRIKDGKDAGIWWNTNKTDPTRHCVSAGSTGGAIRLALELYQTEQTPPGRDDREKLTFAENNYKWAQANLENSNHLYTNSQCDGGASPAHQAWFIDDGRLLYQITKNSNYLTDAKSTANAAATYFDQQSGQYCLFWPSQFAGMFASFVRLSATDSTTNSALSNYVSWANGEVTTDGDFKPSNCGPGDEVDQQAGVSWVFSINGLGGT